MPVDLPLLRRIASEKGYVPATLEKVVRLQDILSEISRHPDFGQQLALKGGTAINFILLPDAPRLSVDLDLNYIGAVSKQEMLAVRPQVEDFLKRIFDSQGYTTEIRSTYGSTTWVLRYANLAANIDTIKVEINWLLRVPIWNPERLPFRPLLPREPALVTVLSREEIVAGKVTALLDRAAARDIFDLAVLADQRALGNVKRVRAATILFGSFSAEDLRERLAQPLLRSIDEREIRNVLWPTLRKGQRPTLRELRKSCEPLLREIPVLGESEQRYLEEFYTHQRFNPLTLFTDMDANPELPGHPMAAWRLQQLRIL